VVRASAVSGEIEKMNKIEKNDFVTGLRDYLSSLYGIKHHYTFGTGDFEGKKIGGSYCLVRRDSNKPKDITGFCFRKDLCKIIPDINKLYDDINSFVKTKSNVKGKLEDKIGLTLKLGKQEYLVHAYIGELYADEITIWIN
jgi:hypothetical protein